MFIAIIKIVDLKENPTHGFMKTKMQQQFMKTIIWSSFLFGLKWNSIRSIRQHIIRSIRQHILPGHTILYTWWFHSYKTHLRRALNNKRPRKYLPFAVALNYARQESWVCCTFETSVDGSRCQHTSPKIVQGWQSRSKWKV